MKRSLVPLVALLPILLLSGCAAETPSGVPIGPAWVTLAYVGVYYAIMLLVLRTKSRLAREYAARGEKFDRYFNQDREMLAADRSQLNMLEHMPMFLVLLWLLAMVGDATEATVAGGVYVVARAAYPLVLGSRLGRGVPTRLLFVTFTSYGALAYLAVRAAMALL